MSDLPTNLEDLILSNTVENSRLEFKATWNDKIKGAVVATVCAFANDLHGLNGGYIILGIAEDENHKPILPPQGIDESTLDRVQKEIYGACKQISPEVQPRPYIETYQGKTILVLWIPAGDNRPYEAPDHRDKGKKEERGRCYFVRPSNSTVKAEGELKRQLIELTAKIPFDDRRNLEAKLTDISPLLVRQHWQNTHSGRIEDDMTDEQLYNDLEILRPVNGHQVPRNVGLLFFNETPERFFPGAKIEVAQFGKEEDLIEEKVFTGPLDFQIRQALEYLNSLGGTLNEKVPGQAEVERATAYPYGALEETIVNAIYHRSYEQDQREPTKIYLYPDQLIITSYPGPMPGLKLEDLQTQDKHLRSPPARNRRIGDFLRRLRLAEQRNTGIRKIRRSMKENGSPAPEFYFTESLFEVRLPVHPRYLVLYTLREAHHLWITGEQNKAFNFLREQFKSQAGSGWLASQLIEYAFVLNDEPEARVILQDFELACQGTTIEKTEVAKPYLTMARLLTDRQRPKEASILLKRMPVVSDSTGQVLETALLKKRLGDFEGAHRLFSKAYQLIPVADAKLLHEFAQTKLKLAGRLWQENKKRHQASVRRFNAEAAELLHRAIQIADSPIRASWCWFDLAKVYQWLRKPNDEIEKAFLNARVANPGESIFEQGYESWKQKLKQF
jgi:ATP-dependent DNA helicase RecG